MDFDWRQYLSQHGVSWVDSGRNVLKGNVNISCPWCGTADNHFHLGIQPETGLFCCWRNREHSGNAVKLIAAISGISFTEARTVYGEEQPATGVDLAALAAKLRGLDAEPMIKPLTPVKPLPEFRLLTVPYIGYLENERGFYAPDIEQLEKDYQLRCALSGPWKWRLIIPFIVNGKWVGWTGRHIGRNELRYLSYPEGDQIKSTVFNHDAMLGGGNVLAIVEGPLDSLKADFYGKTFGVRAVAVASNAGEPLQISAIVKHAKNFGAVRVVLDADATGPSLQLVSKLACVGAKRVGLPPGVKDPGDLNPGQAKAFAQSLIK